MSFDSSQFPKYSQLTFLERFFLRTCCYFPPRERRQKNLVSLKPIHSFQKTYERAFGKEFWDLIKGKKILDFGCGEGGYVLGMAKKGADKVEGIDILPNFKTAEKEAKKLDVENIRFHLGTSTILKDNSYDIIISHDSFEHFEDPAYILSEMTRLVKPGGIVLIKFGPTWMGPYGRHMSGTVRKSRPWVHLIFPEKVIMRCHSVYHDMDILYEHYKDLEGGLNKMTVGKFHKILKKNPSLRIKEFDTVMWRGLTWFKHLPILSELFASGAYCKCVKA